MANKRATDMKRAITSLVDLRKTFRANPTEAQTYIARRRGGHATIVLLQAREGLYGTATGQIELREFGSHTDTVVAFDVVEDARALGLDIGAVTAIDQVSYHAFGTWKKEAH